VKFLLANSCKGLEYAIALSIVPGIIATLMGMGFPENFAWAPWNFGHNGQLNAIMVKRKN